MAKKRKNGNSFLARTHKIAQIVAFLCIPIIGFFVQQYITEKDTNTQKVLANISAETQKAISESNIRKDYMQFAIEVLRTANESNDPAMRRWALEIMSTYSPVDFELQDNNSQIDRAIFTMLDTHPLLQATMNEKTSCPIIDTSTMPSTQAYQVQQLHNICIQNAKDLFWLKVFVGLMHAPSDESINTTPIDLKSLS